MSAFNFTSEPRRREVREITSRGEWLAWRRQDVTASRIGALFDAHPFMTLAEAVADMRGQSVKGDNPMMRAGRWLQAAFPRALADERPEWQVTEATTYHRMPDLRLGATPDFWVYDPNQGHGLIETKTFAEREWERHHGRPPLGYLLQTLAQMIVCDVEWGAVAVLVRSSTMPFYLFDVPRHPAAESRILEAVARFWERMDAGEFPEAIAKDELEALFDDGTYKDLSGVNHLSADLDELETLKAEISPREKRKKEIEDDLKNRLGPASTAWLPGWSITYKSQHRREIPATDFRVLRVKRTEDDDA